MSEIKEYIHWMCNPENIENCTECPENREMRGHYPCGQQNCWVVMHTRNSEDEEM